MTNSLSHYFLIGKVDLQKPEMVGKKIKTIRFCVISRILHYFAIGPISMYH